MRLPPFSKRLAAVLADPVSWRRFVGTSVDKRHVTIWVLCGAVAWDMAREWVDQPRLFVVAPPGEDPARFDWRLLQGHNPVLVEPVGDVSGEEVKALAAALIRDGVQRVLFCGPSGCIRYLAEPAEGMPNAA